MRWIGREQSGNVVDRRGMGGGLIAGGGILGVVALLVSLLTGGDIGSILPGGGSSAPATSRSEEEKVNFVKVVLKDTEDVWNQVFPKIPEARGRDYPEPKLVLFSGSDQTGCGFASSATGPFYCPNDQRLYIDLQFFDELSKRFQAAGDFAQAYVIAHEVGHHIQKQLGILDKLHSMQGRVSEAEFNRNSVRVELQADFLAGVWAHHAQQSKNILEPGDLEEALRAANAIGDDTLQKQGRGHVVPDSFTHGTSAQRVRWFRRGFETGDVTQLNELLRLPYESL